MKNRVWNNGQYSVESKRMRALAKLVVPYSNGTEVILNFERARAHNNFPVWNIARIVEKRSAYISIVNIVRMSGIRGNSDSYVLEISMSIKQLSAN